MGGPAPETLAGIPMPWSARVVRSTLSLVLLAGCTGGVPSAGSVGYARCHVGEPPRDLPELTRLLQSVPDIAGLQGADVAADVPGGPGRFLFAFGDSLVARPDDMRAFIRNSLLIVEGDRVCLVLGSEASAFVPDRDDGVGYWPMSMVRAGPGPDAPIALFLNRVRSSADDGSFVNLGPALARLVIDGSGLPRLLDVVDLGPDDEATSRITWGAAVWTGDDGWAYVYGTSNPGTDLVFGWALHVARARPDRIDEPTSWTYWTGSGWSSDADRAIEVIGADGGVSQTLSVFADGGDWYAVSKKEGFLGDEGVIWTAPRPTGPFTESAVRMNLPSDPDGGIVTYTLLAHPTLYPEPGTVVVSVSVNAVDPSVVLADPRIYRPRFFRTVLP